MNTTVTPEQIAFYRDQGYLIIEDLLSADELATLIAGVMTTVNEMGSRKMIGEGNKDIQYDKDGYTDATFLQRINLWKTNEAVANVFRDPGVGKMLSELACVDGIRIWHDQTLQKLAWGDPTAWHLDTPNWSFDTREALSIWIALDDVTAENGCMYFIPESHKTAEKKRNAPFSTKVGTLFDVYPEWHDKESVAIKIKAGSASIHNGFTAHGAGANMTPGSRRAMVCIYMPDGVTFNGTQNILSAEQMENIKVGDPFDDDEQHPLVWPQA